jgi:hypothetical protein
MRESVEKERKSYLVVTGTEDEFCIGVFVQYPLDYLALWS